MDIEYENNKHTSDFVFSECIKRMDYAPVMEKLEKRRKMFSFLSPVRKNLENKIKEIDDLQKRTDSNYTFIEWFFGEMQRQNLCTAKYKISDNLLHSGPGNDWHSVDIEGMGIYEFPINGKEAFSVSEDGKERSTTIPVMEGSQECNLILFDFPLIELPIFGKLHVDYEFETYFNIGSYESDEPVLFTGNPLETGNWLQDYSLCFYGKPGKLFYRAGDRLDEELQKGVTGVFSQLPRKRKNLNLQAKIYLDDGALFFQGNMECTGTFPFFIRRDKNRRRDSSPKGKKPVGDALVVV